MCVQTTTVRLVGSQKLSDWVLYKLVSIIIITIIIRDDDNQRDNDDHCDDDDHDGKIINEVLNGRPCLTKSWTLLCPSQKLGPGFHHRHLLSVDKSDCCDSVKLGWVKKTKSWCRRGPVLWFYGGGRLNSPRVPIRHRRNCVSGCVEIEKLRREGPDAF